MIAALITLFIPNIVDHPVTIFSLIIGVWCKQDGDTGYWTIRETPDSLLASWFQSCIA